MVIFHNYVSLPAGVYVYIYIYVYIFIYLYVYLFIFLSIYLFFYMYICGMMISPPNHCWERSQIGFLWKYRSRHPMLCLFSGSRPRPSGDHFTLISCKQLEEQHHHCTQNLGPVGIPVAIVVALEQPAGGSNQLKKHACIKWRSWFQVEYECLWNRTEGSCSSNHIQIKLHEHCIQNRSWAIQGS